MPNSRIFYHRGSGFHYSRMLTCISTLKNFDGSTDVPKSSTKIAFIPQKVRLTTIRALKLNLINELFITSIKEKKYKIFIKKILNIRLISKFNNQTFAMLTEEARKSPKSFILSNFLGLDQDHQISFLYWPSSPKQINFDFSICSVIKN